MFKKIDEIEWDKLTHAYGSASDVPGQLRALVSSDEAVRDDALDKLYGNIWHQGTVYEATAYAVPFLVEILQAPEAEDKYRILELLWHLAHGNSYLDVHQHLEWAYSKEKRESNEFKQELQKELDWVKAAHDAVASHSDVYLKLMSEGNEDTRSGAIILLAGLTAQRDEVLPLLQKRLAEETSTSVKAAILFALSGLLPERDQASINGLVPYLDASHEPIIRYFAADAIACLAREKSPPAVLDILVHALNDNENLGQQYRALYWIENNISAAVASTLCFVGYERAKPIIPQLISSLESIFWLNSIPLVQALLYLLFGSKKLSQDTKGHDLTDLQRQALMAIGTYSLVDITSNPPAINSNVASMLDTYGLPSSPDGLEAFLQT